MRLDYAKGGLQFFFVTLASAERRAVFSRLVSESGRPELLDIGELARAALRAVHRVWPAVTVSDYVIMPDHLHFLLIVNYDYDKSIGPLFIAHRVADAVEMAVARGLERTGARAPAPPATPPSLATLAPAKLAEQRAVEMAGLLKASVEAANVVAAAGGLAVEKGLHFGATVGGAGARAPVRSVVFARDCYIELSFDARQLKAIRHYIKLNPARALRETFAIYPAGALRPLSRRQSRNCRWAAANSLVLSRHSWNFLARHEAQPRRRASFSAELPRHERHRGAALRSLTRPRPPTPALWDWGLCAGQCGGGLRS